MQLVVGFNVEKDSVLKVNAVVLDVAEFSNRVALAVELANVVLVLSDPLPKVFCWTICA